MISMRLPIKFISKKHFTEDEIEVIITKNKRGNNTTIDRKIEENCGEKVS